MNGETEEALGAIYKEAGGIEPNNSSDRAFNITVCVIRCHSERALTWCQIQTS